MNKQPYNLRTIGEQIDMILYAQGSARAAIAYLIGAVNNAEGDIDRLRAALHLPLLPNTSTWLAGDTRRERT
jgi:hypothetical protein